jgi:DEAD/DEAH box helicase domain-containing protein
MRHPDYFFDTSVEHAIINPDNPYIRTMHLKAASYELPLSRSEAPRFGGGYVEQVRDMVLSGEMKQVGGRAAWAGYDFPAEEINLRTATSRRFAICTPDGEQLGMMDADTAFQYLHEGAVYLHLGESYLVEELDIDAKVARVVPKILPYYTRSLSQSDVSIDEEIESRKFRGTPLFRGFVNVTSRIHAYKKITTHKNQVFETVDLDYPPEILWTHSLWFLIGDDIQRKVSEANLDIQGGLHAVEHAAIAMLPFLAMCDRDDIGGLSTNYHAQTEQPTIFIHDAHTGGMGLSERGYKDFEMLLERTLDLVRGCPCNDGCPSCIQSPKCGSMNSPLDKKAAVLVLKSILKKKR